MQTLRNQFCKAVTWLMPVFAEAFNPLVEMAGWKFDWVSPPRKYLNEFMSCPGGLWRRQWQEVQSLEVQKLQQAPNKSQRLLVKRLRERSRPSQSRSLWSLPSLCRNGMTHSSARPMKGEQSSASCWQGSKRKKLKCLNTNPALEQMTSAAWTSRAHQMWAGLSCCMRPPRLWRRCILVIADEIHVKIWKTLENIGKQWRTNFVVPVPAISSL